MYLRRVYCKDALSKLTSNQYARRCQATSAAAPLDNPQPFSAIPLAPGAVPLLGHMPFMAKKETQERLHEAFDNLRKKAGDVYRLSIPGEPGFVAIFQPEHVKTLYSVDGRIPNLPGFDPFEYIRKNAMKDRYMITGLINNSEDWYTVRHQVQQDMMRPKSALYYIDDLDDIAGDLADRISTEKSLNDGSVEDMYPILQAFALEAVGSIFLGSRLGAIKGEGDGQRLIEIAEEGLPIVQQLMFIPPKLFRFLPMFKKFVKIQGEAFDICKRHLDETMRKTKDSDETVIAKLMRACGPDSAVPLIMGIDALQVGIDSTASTAAFLVHHLAANPEKQEKLFEEICNVIGPAGKVDEKALGKMRYLKACQTESQRMCPAFFGTSRRLQADTVIGGYQMPKGSVVIRVGHSMSNDPNNFDDPEKFVPERWLRDSEQRHSAHSFANLPWGHGARACIGQRFAKLELYMMMVKLVQRFKMAQEGPALRAVTKLVAVPDGPVKISFSER